MTLLWPGWLFLLIPLGLTFWLWRMPSRLLTILRVSAALSILLAMCGLGFRLPSRAGSVVVVTDRSLSMPPNSDAAQTEAVNLVRAAMGASDNLAVVSFAETAAVEQAQLAASYSGPTVELQKDASNLTEALDLAMSLIPPESSGRILLLSDGRWTGLDPASSSARAASRRVAIDYRRMERLAINDVAFERIDAPRTVSPGESFLITAWVRSPKEQQVTFALTRGEKTLASGRQKVSAGLNRLTFRDQSSEPGTCVYGLSVHGEDKDPVPENNSARLLVGVGGPRPVLCLSKEDNTALAELLTAGRLDVRRKTASQCEWSLAELSKYSAVLIEDVPADRIGVAGMETLAAWVTQTGAGLMTTGGPNAYGPGGYFKSPLDPILPVSMELRREHRKLSLAIVIALDRSGSMAVSVGGGKSKMDLANLASAEVVDLLSGMDEFGCIAVDSSPHTIVDLTQMTDGKKSSVRSRVLSIDSRGGGIFVYEALRAAAGMLSNATSGTRHIILFADAADSEQPGQYVQLLEDCRKANVSVSVIGLGSKADSDAAFLEDIAKRGGGRCFFTEKAEELPRLFAQDTFVVARSSFLEELTAVRPTAGMVSLTGSLHSQLPAIGGYNLCYLRNGANLAAISQDEYEAPIVAAWQAGAGRVLSYAGQADGEFTGPIAAWPDAGEFFTSLARWTAGGSEALPGNMLVTQKVERGICTVTLHLDPQRDVTPFQLAPTVTTLRERTGAAPQSQTSRMRWATADTLEVQIPLTSAETVLSMVDVAGIGKVNLPPTCLPYSPEFAPRISGEGAATLKRIARATGGVERLDLSTIWADLPSRPRIIPVGRWLLLSAVAMLLLEVLQRRTGLLTAWGPLSRQSQPREPKAKAKKATPKRAGYKWLRRKKKPVEMLQPDTLSPQPEAPQAQAPAKAKPPAEAPTDETSVVDALHAARKRARGRMGRK